MINKFSILNGAKHFSSEIFQNYLVFIPAKNYIWYFSGTAIRGNPIECQKKVLKIYRNTNEYNQDFNYYPFAVKLDRCIWRCNALNDLSDKVCVSNKTRFKSKCVQHDCSNKFWILLHVVVKMENI